MERALRKCGPFAQPDSGGTKFHCCQGQGDVRPGSSEDSALRSSEYQPDTHPEDGRQNKNPARNWDLLGTAATFSGERGFNPGLGLCRGGAAGTVQRQAREEDYCTRDPPRGRRLGDEYRRVYRPADVLPELSRADHRHTRQLLPARVKVRAWRFCFELVPRAGGIDGRRQHWCQFLGARPRSTFGYTSVTLLCPIRPRTNQNKYGATFFSTSNL